MLRARALLRAPGTMKRSRNGVLGTHAIAALLCAWLGTATAIAETNEVAGTVLSIDEDDIVIDLGASKGGTDGAVVELWRPLKLRHPVTGKFLVDRFRIGRLKLVQVQRTLAWARPIGDLARAPAEGDIVVLPVEAGAVAKTGLAKASSASSASPLAPSPTAEAKVSDAPPVDASDPEARELSAIFDSLRGQPPATRILRYEQHARKYPTGKYARVLYEEA